jgi:hypothetical protein
MSEIRDYIRECGILFMVYVFGHKLFSRG